MASMIYLVSFVYDVFYLRIMLPYEWQLALYRPKGHITQLSPYLTQKPDWRGRGTPNTGSYHVPLNPAYLAYPKHGIPQTSTHDLYSANHLTMVSRPVATMRIP